jgi:hypothetical protein
VDWPPPLVPGGRHRIAINETVDQKVTAAWIPVSLDSTSPTQIVPTQLSPARRTEKLEVIHMRQ